MGLMYEQVFRVPGHKAWIRENLEKAKKGTTWLLGAKERRISDTWVIPTGDYAASTIDQQTPQGSANKVW